MPRSIYLTPAGDWSEAPVPHLRAVSVSAFTGATRTWRAAPPGRISLGLVVVGSGGNPASRSDWRFRPIVRWIRVDLPRADGDPDVSEGVVVVGGLAIVALAAALVVLVDPAGHAPGP